MTTLGDPVPCLYFFIFQTHLDTRTGFGVAPYSDKPRCYKSLNLFQTSGDSSLCISNNVTKKLRMSITKTYFLSPKS